MKYLTLLLLALTSSFIQAQTDENDIRNRLGSYFDNYTNQQYVNADKIKIDGIELQPDSQVLVIKMNEAFLGQPFTPELVDSIYHDVRLLLPQPYNTWNLSITSCGSTIEQLIPISLQQKADSTRTWGKTDFRGYPWTRNMDRAYSITSGLEGRHLMLWASHGRYYAQDKKSWLWQRPNLFNTCEDIFTQTFVVPFLIPMLENAGAVVFTPRERDWQTHEVIVDNDNEDENKENSLKKGQYEEITGLNPWSDAGTGFAYLRNVYLDKENPFEEGTARQCQAQTGKRNTSSITWTPDIPEDGRYAVYVSYKTLPNSVPDATYKIRHGGITTRVRVNQQMGGGTWVYLGTYEFQKGLSNGNSIQLTNRSNFRGVVTADALRIGGGMGNIARGDTLSAAETPKPSETLKLSGLPRYLEGARYYMQWAGMPYRVYGTKLSQNDYGEDINSRSVGVNHLSRGSVYNPVDTLPGLKVPIELSLAVHSDAGLRKGRDMVGSLGIYTTQFYEGKLATGLTRLTSRDFADLMLQQVTSDMRRTFGQWERRQLYDRNYSETREPQIPSMILEMFSHQNFGDMIYGHDPVCKFVLARAAYKAVLRYVNYMHGQKDPVVEPLPVHALSAQMDSHSQTISLRWQPTVDSLETTAKPSYYILYTANGHGGWDNGMMVEDNNVVVPAKPGILYRFKVTAANTGGQSMNSAEVCARCPIDTLAKSILIVNGFSRLAAPQVIDNDSIRAFDITLDPGVSYMSNPSIFSLVGMNVAGNTFNYPTLHAEDFLMADSLGNASQDLAISSCTTDALGGLNTQSYCMMDVIMGAQRNDGYSHRDYSIYTPQVEKALASYQTNGGNILLSGAYIGEDIKDGEKQDFTSNILKYRFNSTIPSDSLVISGMDTSFGIVSKPNEKIYSTARVNSLEPTEGAFVTLKYADGSAAAVASQKRGNSTLVYGFPIELISDKTVRRKIFNASLYFLTDTEVAR